MEARPRTLFLIGCLLLAAAVALPRLLGMSDTMRGRASTAGWPVK